MTFDLTSAVAVLGRRLAPDKKSEAAREIRRGFPVHFYMGRNGAGKSLAAVYDTLPDLDAGRTVLSTVRLTDYRNPRPCMDPDCWCDKSDEGRHLHAHPAYEEWRTWGQLLRLKGGIVLADEVTGIADSNEGSSLPVQVGNELHQLRRADVVLRLTGLNFIRANKRIREATSGLTRCRSGWPVPASDGDGQPRMWRARRMANWTTYDAQSLPLDDISEGAWEKADRITASRHWIPDSPAIGAYDTWDAVARIGSAVTDTGRCVECEGTRRPNPCTCEDYVAGKPARKGAGAQGRSPSTADLSHRLPDNLPSHLHLGLTAR